MKPRPVDFRSLNFPPKTWVPKRAKIPRKRKRRTRRETIASIELIRDAKRFWRDFQYLNLLENNYESVKP